jgi:hypothetical protein
MWVFGQDKYTWGKVLGIAVLLADVLVWLAAAGLILMLVAFFTMGPG